MSYGRAEKVILRELSTARSRVKEWETHRFWVVSSIVTTVGMMSVAILGVVFGFITDGGAQAALFVPSGIGIPATVGLYFLIRWLYWSKPSGYDRAPTDGPYVALRALEEEYADLLDRQAA